MNSRKNTNSYESFVSDYPIRETFDNINTGLNINNNLRIINDKYPEFASCTKNNEKKCSEIQNQINKLEPIYRDLDANKMAAYQEYTACDTTMKTCNTLKNDITITQSAFDNTMRTVDNKASALMACNTKSSECYVIDQNITDLEMQLKTIQKSDISNKYNDCNSREAEMKTKLSKAKENVDKYRNDNSEVKNDTAIKNDLITLEKECAPYKKKYNDEQNTILDLSTKIPAQEKRLKECKQWTARNCPSDMQTDYDTTAKQMSTMSLELNRKNSEYTDNCTGLGDCSILKRKSDQLFQEYTVVSDQMGEKQKNHSLCIDPTKNDCSNQYGVMKNAKSTLMKDIHKLSDSLQEGFGEEVIDNLIQTSEQNRDLRQEIKKTSSAILKGNGSINIQNQTPIKNELQYRSDQTMYTNILLTTAATSLLFFLFARIK